MPLQYTAASDPWPFSPPHVETPYVGPPTLNQLIEAENEEMQDERELQEGDYVEANYRKLGCWVDKPRPEPAAPTLNGEETPYVSPDLSLNIQTDYRKRKRERRAPPTAANRHDLPDGTVEQPYIAPKLTF